MSLLAMEKFKDIVDPKRVGVFGGSHGGYMTGWLIGHPKYCNLWSAAALWNPVLNMEYMVVATDIPDWIYACNKNEEMRWEGVHTAEEAALFYSRSP